ncbi:MAG: rhodanese-like domain-containing protein [Actinomycetota bacterium]
MTVTTAVKRMSPDEALVYIHEGARYVDLRSVNDYLDVHIPGSFSLQYEFGPGLPGRARDCLPLSVPFLLLEDDESPMEPVAAALRGKGFSVEGILEGGIRSWAGAHGTPASTEVVDGSEPVPGTVLDVNDPGARPPEDALRISIEQLWGRLDAVPRTGPVTVVAGHGVRAALAIGMLEGAGFQDVAFMWRRPAPPLPKKETRRFSFLRPFS